MNFLSLLILLLIGLKLAGFIAWSWWLILLPLYFPHALGACVYSIIACVGLIIAIACVGLIIAFVGLISGKKPRLTLTYKGKRSGKKL